LRNWLGNSKANNAGDKAHGHIVLHPEAKSKITDIWVFLCSTHVPNRTGILSTVGGFGEMVTLA
jgi:hypothetical protein